MVPSFRLVGGKSRLRKWLVDDIFPKNGNLYVEPFAGKGNVFFYARTKLKYQNWLLNDLDSFLTTLRTVDINLLPDIVEKKDFIYWRDNQSDIAKVIEPRITFAGKGYKHGFSGDSGTHVGYRKASYQKNCLTAQKLLENVVLTNHSWEDVKIPKDSFVYFDPPYYMSKNLPYPNINHDKLLNFLVKGNFKWAISGYYSELYCNYLGEPKYERYRNSELKSSNLKTKVDVLECVWTNYD